MPIAGGGMTMGATFMQMPMQQQQPQLQAQQAQSLQQRQHSMVAEVAFM